MHILYLFRNVGYTSVNCCSELYALILSVQSAMFGFYISVYVIF